MSDPATKLLDDRIQKAVDATLEKVLKTGDSGGGGGSMDQRLEAIEKAVYALRTDTNGLMETSGKLVLDVAEIKGKLSQMPTGF
jgi:hypothetical protein